MVFFYFIFFCSFNIEDSEVNLVNLNLLSAILLQPRSGWVTDVVHLD